MNDKVFYGIFVILLFTATPAFAQTISINTDNSTYDEGDAIIISGRVPTIIDETTPITLQIFHENTLVQVGQVDVAQDGSYSHIIITGEAWSKKGEYIITAVYGEGRAQTEFEYYPETETPDIIELFEVGDGGSGTFDVQYIMRGGTIKDMYIDQHNYSLIIDIETEDRGTIFLDIPKNALDAADQNGYIDFIVMVDGIQVPYEESRKDLASRIITIPFDEGDSKIIIIGTHIIPEFGATTIMILAVTITLMTILVKNKQRIWI